MKRPEADGFEPRKMQPDRAATANPEQPASIQQLDRAEHFLSQGTGRRGSSC